MKLIGKLIKGGPGPGQVEIDISNDEILAQISEKERFNLASKLLIKPTKER
jgi:hypothetical protein